MKIPSLFSNSLKLSILLLYIPATGHSQTLNGSFTNTIHFPEKCTPFAEEHQNETYETAWKGERISKAIILWTSDENVEEITFHVPDFSTANGIIPSSSVRIRSVNYVTADLESKSCGDYSNRDMDHYLVLGDILTTSLETSLQPFCPSVYWLTIDIPASTIPGLYKGTVLVTAKGHKLELHLSLQVVDYCLPPVDQWEFHLDLWQFPTAVVDRYNESNPEHSIKYWSDEHFSLLQKKYRLLVEMGQKVITAHIKEGALGSTSMIKWLRRSDDSWIYDFSIFDRYVDSFICWGISDQISCQSPVGWNSGLIPYWHEPVGVMKNLEAPVGSEQYATRWNHFLNAFRKHLEARGWFEKAVLFLDEVEPDKLTWIIEFIKNNHPGWKIGLAGFHTPSNLVASQVYDISLMVGIRGNPKQLDQEGITTFYTSCNPVQPNNFIAGDASPAENIWMGWHAQQKGYDGFLRWAFDNWTHPDPKEQRIGGFTSGDFSFCYRSSNNLDMEIYASIRLELLREGIEDFEKINILKKHLKSSDLPEDAHFYERLLSKIEEFEKLPGESMEVEQLVRSAQQLLNEIVNHSK